MAMPPSSSSSSSDTPVDPASFPKEHPPGLRRLFWVEMWERFSYYGMRGLLVLYLVSVMSVMQVPDGVHRNTLNLTQQIENLADPEKPIEKTVTREHIVAKGPDVAIAPGPAFSNPTDLVFTELKWVDGNDAKDPSDDWTVGGAETGAAHVVRVKDGKAENLIYGIRVSNPTDKPIKFVAQIAREPNPAGGEIGTQTFFTINDGAGSTSMTIEPDSSRKAGDPTYDLKIEARTGDSGRNWTGAEASNLYGWYTGFVYLLPILGGLIADKLIGTHRSMVVGSLLITLGHIVLGLSGIGGWAFNAPGMSIFVFGLALIIVGTGHFKPSVSVMVGQLYKPGDPRRESAFAVFYMGINVGAFTCNLVCGTLAVKYGWHWGFAAAAVGMLAGLAIYLHSKPKHLVGIGEPLNPEQAKIAWVFLPVGIGLSAIVALLFHIGMLAKFDTVLSNPITVGLLSAGAIGYAIWFIASQEKQDRGPVFTIFIYMLFNAVFWLAFEQAGSSLNIFADRDTERQLASNWEFPTTWFQSINPLFIIVFTPIATSVWLWLATRKKYVPQPAKIGLGLIFVGLGYVVMVLAALRLNTGLPKVSMIYIVGCYFLHTVGEIILSPTGLSYVSKTAPTKHVSTLMGIWFISSFIAGLGAGKVAALTEPIMEGKLKLPWNLGGQADFFLLFVITSVAAGVLLLVLSPVLSRLQRDKND